MRRRRSGVLAVLVVAALAGAVALASALVAGDRGEPDGTIVFSVFSGLPAFDGADRCEGLYAVDSDGGRLRRLTAPDRRTFDGHFFPRFSPDGRRLAFEIWRHDGPEPPAGHYGVWSEFFALAVGRGLARRIGRFPSLVFMSPRLDWGAGGREVLVYEARRRSAALVRVDVRSGRKKQLVRGAIGPFAWVPGQARVSYTLGLRARSIWVTDLEGRERRRLLADAAAPVWTRDGTRVAFFGPETGAGERSLLVAGRDGRGRRRLAARVTAAGSTSAVWAPDGKSLLFTRRAKRSTGPYGDVDLYRVTIGGRERVVKRNAIGFAWSPDGSRILFGRPLPRIEAIGLYTAAPDGARERLVAITDEEDLNIGSHPVWQPTARPIRPATGEFSPAGRTPDCLEQLVRLRERFR